MSTQEQNTTYFELSKHVHMWNWLGDHPGFDKHDFNDRVFVNLDGEEEYDLFAEAHYDFACMYALKMHAEGNTSFSPCVYCPFFHEEKPNAECCFGLHYRWKRMNEIYNYFVGLRHVAQNRDIQETYEEYARHIATEIRDLCRRIAELPVGKGITCF